MIRAAGGVLWRDGPSGREVAVVHRPRYDDWSLPKGKLQPDEPHLLAAVREVREETGIACTAGPSLGETSYQVDGVAKTVRWWALRADDGSFAANDEVDALRWLTPADALALVVDTGPLRAWMALPPDVGVLVLVRHGSAGDPDAWRGEDGARPLDERGVAQSLDVARVLAAYRPRRILSAPPLRCRQTIEPLARASGVAVEIDDAVGEVGAPVDVERHVAGLAAPGATVVVCSQGGVIPRVVAALGRLPGPVRARKGSVWALTVGGGGAAAVDGELLS